MNAAWHSGCAAGLRTADRTGASALPGGLDAGPWARPCLGDRRAVPVSEQKTAARRLRFRALVALREKGQGEEAIAAAFYVTQQIVKQRLKLASVVPALLEVQAEDGMTLEQLMAFTGNPDHARQVQVWDVINSSWNREPFQLRCMLTETSARASTGALSLWVLMPMKRRAARCCMTSFSAMMAVG